MVFLFFGLLLHIINNNTNRRTKNHFLLPYWAKKNASIVMRIMTFLFFLKEQFEECFEIFPSLEKEMLTEIHKRRSILYLKKFCK